MGRLARETGDRRPADRPTDDTAGSPEKSATLASAENLFSILNWTIIQRPQVIVKRSLEQITRHYSIERELADKLRMASRGERKALYTILYNELFYRVPDHPQVIRKQSPKERNEDAERQFSILKRFITNDTHYLEIGAGDCSLSVRMAQQVRQVYALEVSDTISQGIDFPANLDLRITDGIAVPIGEDCIDVAYSNQLMEHLHADDAFEQLSQIYRALRRGGVYVCVTPNRLSGPHDISQFFDKIPRGFHLREYSNSDLVDVFRAAGFGEFRILLNYRSVVLAGSLPLWPVLAYENLIARLPEELRKLLAYPLLGVKFIGYKI